MDGIPVTPVAPSREAQASKDGKGATRTRRPSTTSLEERDGRECPKTQRRPNALDRRPLLHVSRPEPTYGQRHTCSTSSAAGWTADNRNLHYVAALACDCEEAFVPVKSSTGELGADSFVIALGVGAYNDAKAAGKTPSFQPC